MSEKPELKPCPFCGGKAYIGQTNNGEWHINTLCGVDKPAYHSAFVIADTEAEAVEAWNTRAATTIGQVAVEVVPTVRACKLEPLNAFYTDLNGLNQTEWGVCSNCGTASPIDATYCCECGAKVVER